MNITLKNKCKIEGLNKYIVPELTKKLTIANPVFGKKMDLQLSVFGVAQYLKFYELPDERTIIIPIGAYQEIYKSLEDLGEKPDKATITDERAEFLNDPYFSTLKFTGDLRDYQAETVQACLKTTNGVIESMTGSGKTVIFVALTVERKQPTLILVNTIELVNQTVASFLKFTNIENKDIGFIGSGKFIIKPITIALHQTMAKLTKEQYSIINKSFSQVIADEVQ
jgi:superfamily II DNA or RNA helicase